MYEIVNGYKFKNLVIPEGVILKLTLSDDTEIDGVFKYLNINSGMSIVKGDVVCTVQLDSIQHLQWNDTEIYPSYYIGEVKLLKFDNMYIEIGDNISIKYKKIFNRYIRSTKVIGFTENKIAIETAVIDLEKVIKIIKK